MKQAKAILKTALKWLLILLLAHLLCMLLYGMILKGTTYDLAYDYPDDLSVPSMLTWIFGAAFTVLFVFGIQRFDGLSPSDKSELKKARREGSFSAPLQWRKRYLGELLTSSGLLLVLQIPFAAFFAKYGFSFLESVLLERFFILEAGAYLLTGSVLLGILFNLLWWALWLFVVRFFSILLTAKSDD